MRKSGPTIRIYAKISKNMEYGKLLKDLIKWN